MFSKVTLGNTDACRTEAEISDGSGRTVAIVYEAEDGWHVEYFAEITPDERDGFDAVLEKAKSDLSHYVNRMGLDAPRNLTRGALSAWLMQKDDGTALGIRIAPVTPKDS